MSVPEELHYTPEHEWVAISGSIASVGITDHAQKALGDVVFVSAPAPGTKVSAGEPCGEVESTKSVSDIYAPAAGVVVEANNALADAPQRLNEDPYGDGWICVIQLNDPGEYDGLLDAQAYRNLIST